MQGHHCQQVPLMNIEICRVVTAGKVTVPLVNIVIHRVITANETNKETSEV